MADATLAALESQVACYRRLAKLAQVQHVHVQQNHTEGLLEVLKTRQGVLDEISRLEIVIHPAKQKWADYLSTLDADLRKQAETYLADAKKLLGEITAADQDDAMVLQQRKLNLGTQINKANAARQINRNYAAAAYGSKPSRMNLQQ